MKKNLLELWPKLSPDEILWIKRYATWDKSIFVVTLKFRTLFPGIENGEFLTDQKAMFVDLYALLPRAACSVSMSKVYPSELTLYQKLKEAVNEEEPVGSVA